MSFYYAKGFRKIIFLMVGALIVLMSRQAIAQDNKVDGKIHAPSEIGKIMESSKLTYQITELKDPVSPAKTGPVLSNQLFIKTTNGNNELKQYALSQVATDTLASAEKAFDGKQYEEALKLYRSIHELEPSYSYALTLMGDVFYRQGDYQRAKVTFEQAIQGNFIDYQAHWFLADTLWSLGEKERAMDEITIAHVLNVNHPEIKKVLKKYRSEIGRRWQDWKFNPQYVLNKEGEKVVIKAQRDWLGYALVKALWKHEPGYAEKMFGPNYKDQVICFLEEKEALVPLLAAQPNAFKHIENIIKDGFVNELILYEMVATRAPASLLLLPKGDFMKVVNYIDRYH